MVYLSRKTFKWLYPRAINNFIMETCHSFNTGKTPVEEIEDPCTVIAEILPANCSYQDLIKKFSAAGRIRHIRVRNPCDPKFSGCSTEVLIRKESMWFSERIILGLHVLVEYSTPQEAIRAVYYFGRYRVRPRNDYCIASEYRAGENDLDRATALEQREEVNNTVNRRREQLIKRTSSSMRFPWCQGNNRLFRTENPENTPEGEEELEPLLGKFNRNSDSS